MKEKLFLGIDGGGTKTGFSLINEEGKVLATSRKGTIHIKQVNREDFIKILNEGIDEVLKISNKSREDLAFVFAGVPAYGEYADMIDEIHDRMSEVLGHDRYRCGNDCVAGWAGSQACKPGVNMVLGTGAIAFGMDYFGNETRSSGWGHFCGDEGSAYWIGKKTIEIFTKESDGRYERGPLYDIIKKEFNLENDFDFISIVTVDMNQDRTKIATLAPFLNEAALDGDKYAKEVFDQVAYEVFISVKAVIEKLDFKEKDKIYVSYSGGVFNIGKLLTDKIEELLAEDSRVKIIESILEPQEGAALMAYKISEKEIPEQVVENLRRK